MDFEHIYNWNDYVPLYNFDLETITKLEAYLRQNLFSQDKVIESVINLFKSNTLRTSYCPMSILLSWPPGVGKSHLVNLLSEYFMKEKKIFPLYRINMNDYYVQEMTWFLGSAPGFSGSDTKSVFEDIGEIQLNNENPRNSIIIYVTEIEKCKKNSTDRDSVLHSFFKNIMMYLNEPIHHFKGGAKRTQTAPINLCNSIFILDGNLYSDTKLEYSKKIWFTDEDIKKQDEEKFYENNKMTKEKFLSYLKKEIPMSAYSRITYSPNSVILFDDLWSSKDEIKRKIYQKEYEELLTNFKQRYKQHSNLFTKFESNEIKQELYFDMISKLDPDTWIRWLKNFVEYNIKNKIIDEIVIPNSKLFNPRNLYKKEVIKIPETMQ